MAIPLTGAEGLWTRLGKLIGGLNEYNTARGATAVARLDTVDDEYENATRDVLDGSRAALLTLQAQDQWPGQIKTWAQNTLVRMAQDDGYPGTGLAGALEYLRVQMRGTGTMAAPEFSILKPAVGVTIAAVAGNLGTGVFRASVVSPVDALAMDYTIAEAAPLVCTAHSYPGGQASAGNEAFAWAGDPAARNDTAHDWPLGSGRAAGVSVLDTNNGVVLNGGFEAFAVANTPDSWTVMAGNPGTTILRGTAPQSGVVGEYNLQFVGDGAVVHRIRQAVPLQPQAAYAVNWFHRVQAAPGAGSIRVRLEDAAGAVVNDEAGTANSIAVALAGVGVNYESAGGWFYTPRILPAAVYLVVEVTGAALANAKVLDIDRLVVGLGTQLYAGGPLVAGFAGATPFAIGDQFLLTTTNSFGVATLARGLDRLWDLRANAVRIPSRAVADGGTTTNAVVV